MKKDISKKISALLLAMLMAAYAVPSASVFAAENNVSSASSKTGERDSDIDLVIPLDGSPITLERGVSYKIPETFSKIFPGLSYKLSTSNKSVISIKDNVITAKGTGTCTLSIKFSNGLEIKKEVTVVLPEVTIKFVNKSVTVGKGESSVLKTILSGTTGKITWSSSNKTVATVDSNGKIIAKNVGSSTITATLSNGNKADCKIIVKAAPTYIQLSDSKLVLGTEEKKNLSFTLNGNAASYNITYTSSNPAIARVDSKSGQISALKTGKVTITVKTYNGKTASCTVEVKKAPTSIKFDKNSITLIKNGTAKLKTTLSAGSAGKVTFKSSNELIAKVNASGTVTAVAPGVAYISATTYNGKSAVCKVTVK